MDIILFVYVREEEYGKRFLRFLLRKKHPRLHPELVTRYEVVNHRVETERQKIVVLTDDRKVYEEEKRQVILLSDEQSRENGKIFQYQQADEIYDELLVQIGIEKQTVCVETKQSYEKGVYCICSPSRQDSTVMAVMLSQYLACYGSTLYINLSEFPYYFEEQLLKKPNFCQKGIGELIFLTDRKRFKEREAQCHISFGNANMLPSMPYYKDLLDSTADDWQEILQRLQKECGYEKIVIQINELMECSLAVMEKSDYTWFLYPRCKMGEIEKEVFSHYCQLEKREALLEKVQWVEIPAEVADWQEIMEQQGLMEVSENKQAMACMEQFVKGGEGEDVCLVEDFG